VPDKPLNNLAVVEDSRNELRESSDVRNISNQIRLRITLIVFQEPKISIS